MEGVLIIVQVVIMREDVDEKGRSCVLIELATVDDWVLAM